MRHTRPITVAKADTGEKQDAAGIIFLQIWFTVLSLILTKGFD